MSKRTYPKACKYCDATGFIHRFNMGGSSSTSTETCPVCNGNKVITVIEED